MRVRGKRHCVEENPIDPIRSYHQHCPLSPHPSSSTTMRPQIWSGQCHDSGRYMSIAALLGLTHVQHQEQSTRTPICPLSIFAYSPPVSSRHTPSRNRTENPLFKCSVMEAMADSSLQPIDIGFGTRNSTFLTKKEQVTR